MGGNTTGQNNGGNSNAGGKCTSSCSSCKYNTSHSQSADDAACAPCANGQSWWPCNVDDLCYCADESEVPETTTQAPVTTEAVTTEAPTTQAPTTEATTTEAPVTTTQAPQTTTKYRRETALTQSQQQRSQRHKHQQRSPLRVLLEVNVMLVVNLASLFLEITRQRLIPTAHLVAETPCNLGGRAT